MVHSVSSSSVMSRKEVSTRRRRLVKQEAIDVVGKGEEENSPQENASEAETRKQERERTTTQPEDEKLSEKKEQCQDENAQMSTPREPKPSESISKPLVRDESFEASPDLPEPPKPPPLLPSPFPASPAPAATPRPPRVRKSVSLCSIPEHSSLRLSRPLRRSNTHSISKRPSREEEEEEPICHRSPVTLANGYRPVMMVRTSSEEMEESEKEMEEDEEEEITFLPKLSSGDESDFENDDGCFEPAADDLDDVYEEEPETVCVPVVVSDAPPPVSFQSSLCSVLYCSLVFLLLVLASVVFLTSVLLLMCFGHQPPPAPVVSSPVPDEILPASVEPPIAKTTEQAREAEAPTKEIHAETKEQRELPKEESVTEKPPVVQPKEEEAEPYIVKATPKDFSKESAIETQGEKPETKEEEEQPKTKAEVEDVKGSDKESEGVEKAKEDMNETTPETEEAKKAEKESEKPEMDIPSFREWSQKALEEEQKKKEEDKRKKEEEKKKQAQQKQTVSNTEDINTVNEAPLEPVVKNLKKNFASLDCGAKIISANPESQGAGNIISHAKDEYMLNKCTDKAWFVVELCESIKALRIEIANFELYSSVPNEFRVTMGNSYPAREKDWALFGHFNAEEDRSVQTFHAPDGVFGKYAKVEILSHHGSEHYCPVSHFKIFGVSEIELIGGDDDDDDDDLTAAVTSGEGNALDEEGILEQKEGGGKSSGIVSFIKEKVDETIERVVGVFRPKRDNVMTTALNESSLAGNSFMFDIACPQCDVERYRDVYFILSSQYFQLKQTLAIKSLRASMETGVCQSLGFQGLSAEFNRCVDSKVMDFYKTLFGTSRVIALCNVIAVEQFTLAKATSQAFCEPKETEQEAEAMQNSTNAVTEDTKDSTATKNEDTNKPAESSGITDAENVTPSKPESEKPSTPKGETSDAKKSEAKKADPSKKEDTKQDNLKKEEKPATEKDDKAVAADKSTDMAAKDPELKDPPKVVHVTPSSASHISSSTGSSSSSSSEPPSNGNGGAKVVPPLTGSVGPATPGQRESVWQKLSNKIKSLERNVTLSSGYLEELSVRYKKQIEDLQLSVRQASEALVETNLGREEDRREIAGLKDKMDKVSAAMDEITSQLETISAWALGFHAVFLIIEIMIGFVFLFACYTLIQRQPKATTSILKTPSQATLPRSSTPMAKVKPTKADNGAREKYGQRRPSFECGAQANAGQNGRRKSLEFNFTPSVIGDASNNSQQQQGTPNSNSSSLSKRQRKRMQRRLNKIASAGRLEELAVEAETTTPLLTTMSPYHTFHGEQKPPSSSNHRRKRRGLFSAGSDSDADDSPLSEGDIPSRFKVVRLPEAQRVQGIATNNMFGVLNNSLHDDPTPVKQKSLAYQSAAAAAAAAAPEVSVAAASSTTEDEDSEATEDSFRRQKQKKKPRIHHRSKSTSPQRVGQTAKQREIFKSFNPEKAEWIK